MRLVRNLQFIFTCTRIRTPVAMLSEVRKFVRNIPVERYGIVQSLQRPSARAARKFTHHGMDVVRRRLFLWSGVVARYVRHYQHGIWILTAVFVSDPFRKLPNISGWNGHLTAMAVLSVYVVSGLERKIGVEKNDERRFGVLRNRLVD